MSDFPTWVNLAIVFVFANLIFHIIYLIDHRIKAKGVLFSQPATRKSRIFAGLLGVILGGGVVAIGILGSGISQETAMIAMVSVALLGYSFGIDKPLQQIQSSPEKIFPVFTRNKKIVGIKGKTIGEILPKVRAGAKFVVFEYCISPLIVTLDYESNIHFIDADEVATRVGLRYNIISLLLGWESLFGFIHTIRCVTGNFRGGNDVTQPVVDWLIGLQGEEDNHKDDKIKIFC